MIEVEVEDDAWRVVDGVEALAARAATATLSAVGPSSPRPVAGGGASLVVLLTDDGTVRDLNARFRGKDAATNVLAFPSPASAGPHLGDVALAAGVCIREAAAQGKSLPDHLSHLVVHGVLHLLGYDHMEDLEAEAMERRERAVLAGLGIADPYRLEGAGV